MARLDKACTGELVSFEHHVKNQAALKAKRQFAEAYLRDNEAKRLRLRLARILGGEQVQ
jgi:hypothetical protein